MGVGDNERVLNAPTRHLERVFGDGSVLIDNVRYPVFLNRVAQAPTITRVLTTDANWTEVFSNETKIVKWRISELNGNDIYYAYEASPGNNHSIAYGWEAQNTGPGAMYVKRPGGDNIDVRVEIWKFD